MKSVRPLIMALLLLPALVLAAVADLSREELAREQQAGADIVIVDVRSADEYAAGHLPGAINIPHDLIGARAGELAAHRNKGRIVLYCRSGRRVGIAAEALGRQGFDNLWHLTGDYPGWQQAGLRTEPCTSC